jgi:hypothetical protein
MDTTDPRQATDRGADASARRRAWSAPRVVDHGSLRWFVRNVSGNSDDGHTGTSGGGGTMFSKPKT